jgi:hypothetical protein
MLHVLAALAYMQFDLLVARWYCGAEHFGSVNAPGLMLSKLALTPKLGDGGMPSLFRSFAEFNGALLHEIFWNLCICQNFIDRGWSVPAAIAAVPLISCAVHAVTSNVMVGIRCAPQFCWVAMAYHASGSVLPPGFIHAMWYITDGKLLVNLATLKRDWDFHERREEHMTPPPDRPFFFGWLCILSYYGVLNALAERYPSLRSVDPHVSHCRLGSGPAGAVEWLVMVGFCIQIVGGIATWNAVRAGMDILAETGDATTNGFVRVENALASYLGRAPAWEEQEALPAYSSGLSDQLISK